MITADHEKHTHDALSFKPVLKYIVVFYFLVLVTVFVVGLLYAASTMKSESSFVAQSTKTQIDYRVNNTIALTTALAQNSYFTDPSIPYEEKAVALNKYSDAFDYFMICIVDKDFNVYNETGTDANLAGRDYMQKLLATGEVQVTDCFAAGADGVTLNYTVAAPLMRDGVFDGVIFAAIYFDEIAQKLTDNIYGDYQQLVLFNSKNQIMSASGASLYGMPYTDTVESSLLFGKTVKQVEADMYNQVGGSYWCIDAFNPCYVSYLPIENTPWMLTCTVDLWGTMAPFLPSVLGIVFLTSLACAILIMLAKRYIKSQMSTVTMLVSSVQDLEKKIYQNEKPDNMDFREIISLTSKGLTDGLTGVITRTVFLNQVPFKINALNEGEQAILCFIDVDDLKIINDTYGHNIGDIALKNVGYVLREYEKKYDGLVGRHGGDEFVMLLTGFSTLDSLDDLMVELVKRLHTEISLGDEKIAVQCSVGVALCSNKDEDVETVIKQADTMLYLVKQNGKGSFRIFGAPPK
ncbi:MAG: sensor domain-containing diguanylate cyclase [Raoultibacter sp.]